MSKRFCTACGTQLPEGGRFCTACGKEAHVDAPVEPAAVPAVVPAATPPTTEPVAVEKVEAEASVPPPTQPAPTSTPGWLRRHVVLVSVIAVAVVAVMAGGAVILGGTTAGTGGGDGGISEAEIEAARKQMKVMGFDSNAKAGSGSVDDVEEAPAQLTTISDAKQLRCIQLWNEQVAAFPEDGAAVAGAAGAGVYDVTDPPGACQLLFWTDNSYTKALYMSGFTAYGTEGYYDAEHKAFNAPAPFPTSSSDYHPEQTVRVESDGSLSTELAQPVSGSTTNSPSPDTTTAPSGTGSGCAANRVTETSPPRLAEAVRVISKDPSFSEPCYVRQADQSDYGEWWMSRATQLNDADPNHWYLFSACATPKFYYPEQRHSIVGVYVNPWRASAEASPGGGYDPSLPGSGNPPPPPIAASTC